MTPQELTIALIQRIKKYRLIIIFMAIITAIVFALYAFSVPKTFTSSATIFPLTSNGAGGGGSSALSALFGGGDNSNSFTDNTSVNIIELAQSRTTREEVAAMKDTARGNKTIAELLINDINEHKNFMSSKIPIPSTQNDLITLGASILQGGLSANINKNNSFVISYSGYNPDLVKIISYGFIERISTYYIELNREKAKRDFEFATLKADSLRDVMNSKDNKLISIDQRTLFTNTNKMQYKVPTENLITDKQMIRQQYAVAVANQQNAAYKLQKDTPVMKVLDKPDPPYNVQRKSPIMYGLIGLFIGLIIGTLCFTLGLLIKYIKDEIKKSLYGEQIL